MRLMILSTNYPQNMYRAMREAWEAWQHEFVCASLRIAVYHCETGRT